jgi:UDP-glucose 4-epimerase
MENSGLPKVVAVTGAAGYIGRRLIARLEREEAVEKIVATDIRCLPVAPSTKVYFVQQDITEPLTQVFQNHGVEAVAHLAFVLRQGRDRKKTHETNVGGAANVLRACSAAGVRRMVVLSSSTVYGPHADNPAALTEKSTPRPLYGFQYVWDKATSERLFLEYAASHPQAEVSILRSCVVMGPSARNFIATALFKRMLVGIRGHDPPLQFVHENDVEELLWRFVTEAHPGIYNVAGPGAVRWSQLAHMARRPLLWLPASLAYPLVNLTWWLRLQNDAPAVGLDFVRYPWVVDTGRLEHETGHRFAYTSEEAVQSFLDAVKKR